MDGSQQIVLNLQKTLGKMEIALGAINEAIVWTNEEGHILWCNTPFDLLVCRNHIDVLGQSFPKIMHLQLYDEDVDLHEHPLEILKASGVLEKTMYDYARAGVQLTLQVSGSTVHFHDDQDIFIFCIEDVTKIRRAQDLLHLANENLEARAQERAAKLVEISKQFEAIHDNAVDAIITINSQGMIQSLNPAVEKIFGYGADELSGRNVNILMPEPYHSRHDAYIRDYVETGRSKIIGIGREIRGLRKNGEQVPLYLAVSEVQLGEGQQQRLFTGIMRDISEQKAIMEALEQAKIEAEEANRAKSDFLARISHEIRTPLNAILGMADLLSESALDEEQAKHVRVSKAAGHHLVNIIEDLLDVARIEAGKLELDNASFNLQELVDDVISIVQLTAKKKDLVVFQSIEAEVPVYLEGDAKRLRQILINLMGNSVKFTEKGGISLHIGIAEEHSNQGVMLNFRISDTGIGISEEMQQQIFESFSQADSLITRKYGGTGLGLTISRALVQLMGGDISVESEVGKGSSFTFTAYLKRSDEDTFREALDEEKLPEKIGAHSIRKRQEGQPINILLAEDSENNQLLFTTYLKKLNCTVDIADNGQIAVDKFKSGSYHIVLLDIQMPLMDGYTAARIMRKYEKEHNLSPVPMIALTAHAQESDKKASLEAGFTVHVVKPVSKKVFIDTIKSLT